MNTNVVSGFMSERDSGFAVLGAGNGGLAIAGHLALKGYPVAVYGRREERLAAIRAAGGLELTGAVQGSAPISLLSTDMEEVLGFAKTVLVVVPASAHRDLAEKCAPFLTDEHVVVLLPGRTGGALEFRQVIRAHGNDSRAVIAEAGTFPYASRYLGENQVRIFGIKKTVSVAALPATEIATVMARLHFPYPEMSAVPTVLRTSLDNMGAIFHPAPTLLNAARIHDTGGAFDHYHEGISPEVAQVLEAMDSERVAVAAALGVKTTSAVDWLHETYGVQETSLFRALRENQVYAGIKAASDLGHRYVTEDVPCSLVPIASLGQALGVPTPAIRAIIQLASLMTGIQFWKIGRTVDKLGLAGRSAAEILSLVDGGVDDAVLTRTLAMA